MKINITGALKCQNIYHEVGYAEYRRAKIKELKALSKKLWPGKNASSQYQNMRLLENGTIKTYSFELIAIICESCGVDPNYLFGFKKA